MPTRPPATSWPCGACRSWPRASAARCSVRTRSARPSGRTGAGTITRRSCRPHKESAGRGAWRCRRATGDLAASRAHSKRSPPPAALALKKLDRVPDIVVHRAKVGRDELAVVGLSRGRQVLPARDRAAAPRGTAQAHAREVVNREIAHRIVERHLVPGGNRPAGDEVEGLRVVKAHTTV